MGNDFKNFYIVPKEQLKDKDYEKFNKTYNKFLSYLKTINFTSIFPSTKATANNYKDLIIQDNSSKNELSDENVSIIIKFIDFLSSPKYKKYWDKKTIPNRSSEPNYENLTENKKSKIKSQYEKTLEQEDTNIRLMTYINELHKKYLIYKDHSIRNYYINLCTSILLQYSKSHPQEIAKIHFRFKSPKGLATKLAKNIIVNGHYERNPKTGIDTFKYKDISDAFGAKIVSEKGYCPNASLNGEIQSMIESRDKKIAELIDGEYEIFSEKIDEITSDGSTPIKITYREYYQKCLEILKKHKNIINPKEKRVIKSIEQQIAHLNELSQDADNRSILDENIKLEDYKIFNDPQTNYKNFLTEYQLKITSPLSLAGLKRGLNKIFYNSGTTDDKILESSILSAFGIKVFKAELKSTSSGHEAIHYDIETPYGIFELQAQDSSQYESDKKSPTAAHSLMDGKEVPLYKIPSPYDSSTIKNFNDFVAIKNRDDSIQYYKKSELRNFLEKVENLTAKKGKISYNEGLENAQIDLYSSLYNYFSLAMEIPDNHKDRSKIKSYFRALEEKPVPLRFLLFKHNDTISRHRNFPEIKSFILPFNFNKKSPSTLNQNTQEISID